MKHNLFVWGVSCILMAMLLTGCNTSENETVTVEADTVEATEQPEPQTSLY